MPTEKAAPHRAKKEKSRVYSFFLLSYTLILLVSLSSCLFFGAEVAQQLRREEALNKQALLTSLKNDVEENLMGGAAAGVRSGCSLVKHPSVSSVHDAMDQMAGMAVSRDFLLDYFLYVRSTDEVVTSTVRMSADKFFDIIYEFTDLTAQALREGTLAEYHFQDYLPAGGLRQYDSDTVIRVIPYVQSIPISSSAPPPGQVMLLLDSDKFFAHALSLQSATGGSVYVLDDTGAAVYQTPDAPGLPAGVLNSAEALVTADHISYTRYVSEETGWTYFITSPANLYFTDNLSTIGFLGGVFAVYLLLGLFLVRRIARRSYRPVKDINDLILQSAPGGAGDDEFAVIKSTLLNQMRSGTELQRIIEAQRPAVVRDLLLQLLLGQTLAWDGARSQLDALYGVSAAMHIAVLAEADLTAPFSWIPHPAGKQPFVARLVQNVGCIVRQRGLPVSGPGPRTGRIPAFAAFRRE
ncbi:MAG: hypothetical protein ACLSWY_05035 [Ruthenibacterium lactatiformans]